MGESGWWKSELEKQEGEKKKDRCQMNRRGFRDRMTQRSGNDRKKEGRKMIVEKQPF